MISSSIFQPGDKVLFTYRQLESSYFVSSAHFYGGGWHYNIKKAKKDGTMPERDIGMVSGVASDKLTAA